MDMEKKEENAYAINATLTDMFYALVKTATNGLPIIPAYMKEYTCITQPTTAAASRTVGGSSN